jgi:hypothetical protein
MTTAAVDEEDLEFGPARRSGPQRGDVGRAIMPIPVRDVPGSAWQEEQVIRADFDAVSGITDAMDPQGRRFDGDGGAAGAGRAVGPRIELGSRGSRSRSSGRWRARSCG